MPSLEDHSSSKFVKLLYIGDSGSGKTGSLTSLVAAGYKLRILDLDNGLDALRSHASQECPDKLKNVDFETRRDEYTSSNQGPVIMRPTAYVESVKLLDEWTDETKPKEWGEDTIFVLDSLSALGAAAYAWADRQNPSAKDKRQIYHTAQQSIVKILDALSSPNFECNVIVISHVLLKDFQEGLVKGYVNSIGSAIGPTIPKFFNTLVLAESIGSGKNVKRCIKTMPTGIIDLKNPASFKIDAELPLETGMATLFEQLKEI